MLSVLFISVLLRSILILHSNVLEVNYGEQVSGWTVFSPRGVTHHFRLMMTMITLMLLMTIMKMMMLVKCNKLHFLVTMSSEGKNKKSDKDFGLPKLNLSVYSILIIVSVLSISNPNVAVKDSKIVSLNV